MLEQEELFPVFYNGKKYTEEECNDIFLCFYDCKEALNYEGGVQF